MSISKEEVGKVKWFKKELESYLNQEEIRKSINEKLEMLTGQFEPHSKQWTGIHYTSEDSDTKLANYVDKKKELEKELEVLDYQQARVNKILGYMPQWIAKDILRIYTGKETYENLANNMNISKTYVKRIYDSEMAKAIQEYEKNM